MGQQQYQVSICTMKLDTNVFVNVDTHQSFVMLILMNARLSYTVTLLYVQARLVPIISALAGMALTVSQHDWKFSVTNG